MCTYYSSGWKGTTEKNIIFLQQREYNLGVNVHWMWVLCCRNILDIFRCPIYFLGIFISKRTIMFHCITDKIGNKKGYLTTYLKVWQIATWLGYSAENLWYFSLKVAGKKKIKTEDRKRAKSQDKKARRSQEELKAKIVSGFKI